MATVELVSNPAPDTSTHRLLATGLHLLNRRNKLSSLPFWAPNHVMKRHQFRIVLIRGMVQRERAADDPIGLLLELIPPPTDAGGAFPGGCRVTARVVNRLHEDDRTRDVTRQALAQLDAQCGQLSFPELAPAHLLDNPEFSDGGDAPSLLLELTLQTGVNVAAEHVARTVHSVWSSLTETIGRALQRATDAYREEVDSPAAAERRRALAERVPWRQIPAAWRAGGRDAAWRHLVAEQLVADEGTFRYGPSRGLSGDEMAALVQCGLHPKQLLAARAQFDFDRDVHEGLLDLPALRAQRYRLVPRCMREEVFWANYFWKVAALGVCEGEEQVRVLCTVLNAPPAVRARDMRGVRDADEETVAARVANAQEAADLLIEYLTDEAEDSELLIEAAATACEGHAKQLDGYFKRTDLSETTLQKTGSVLRRLRERLAEYEEWAARQKKRIATPVHIRVEAEREPSEGAADTPEPMQTLHEEEEEEETEASTRREGEEEERMLEKPTHAPRQTTGETSVAVEDAHTTTATTTSSPDGGKTSVGKVDFPLMPWEEEEGDE